MPQIFRLDGIQLAKASPNFVSETVPASWPQRNSSGLYLEPQVVYSGTSK